MRTRETANSESVSLRNGIMTDIIFYFVFIPGKVVTYSVYHILPGFCKDRHK